MTAKIQKISELQSIFVSLRRKQPWGRVGNNLLKRYGNPVGTRHGASAHDGYPNGKIRDNPLQSARSRHQAVRPVLTRDDELPCPVINDE